MSGILSFTQNAAADALKLFFEPVSKLLGARKQKGYSVKSQSALGKIAPEVTYAEIESIRRLRNLEKALSDIVKIDISFAKEDYLYADMLKEVLDSRKVSTELKKVWVKRSHENHAADVEVIVWSHNFASRIDAYSEAGIRNTHKKFFAIKVDDSQVSLSRFNIFDEVDVAGLTVRAAAETLLTKIIESKPSATSFLHKEA